MCYYDDINFISYIKMSYPKIITYLKDYLAENLNTLNSVVWNIKLLEKHIRSTRNMKLFDLLKHPIHFYIMLSKRMLSNSLATQQNSTRKHLLYLK